MKSFNAVACIVVGVVGCVARPPPELGEMQSSSVCEDDNDCCLVVDDCSVADFAVDRTQAAEAQQIASQDIPYESCAKTFADPQRLTPTCQERRCVVVESEPAADKSVEQLALEACTNPAAIGSDVD